MLASKNRKVILVDADPQCNLTGMVLGYKSPDEFDRFYQTEKDRNLRAGLEPSFESRPKLIEGIDCVPVSGRAGLFLLPGHIGIAEWEVTLGIAQELSASISALANLPGSIPFLLAKTAEKTEADYILIDMSPSLSSINENLLMTSDFFILPTNPDCFSVMAINSLASVLPRWHDWAKRAATLPVLRNADYPFPEPRLKFLGTIVQKYRPRGGAPTTGFQKWIDEINKVVVSGLAPALENNGIMLPKEAYQGIDHFCLASIPDFNTLIAKSQDSQTPVFALTPAQIGQVGVVLGTTMKKRDEFKRIFSDLATRVIQLTDASGD
jgi:cellulose biosynthesis protein BcsQ